MNEVLFLSFFCLMATISLMALWMGKSYLLALLVIFAVLMNVFVVKPFEIFSLTTYGGNILSGCIFLITDLLDEHFGKKEALKGVKMGFLALILYFLISTFYLHLEVDLLQDGAEQTQMALKQIFSPALGIIIASITAFSISNSFDILLYNFIKQKTAGKFLWLRNNLSTLVSQFLDTFIFTFIATLFGIFSFNAFGEIILFAYIFKLAVALLDTPFIYLSKMMVIKK